MKQYFWRFAPPAVALGSLLLTMVYASSRPVVESHHVSLIVAGVVWLAIASWVCWSNSHTQLSKYLRGLSPALVLLYAALVLLLVGLVYLNRRTVPLAVVPLVLALLHSAAASALPRQRLLRVLGVTTVTGVLLELGLLVAAQVPIPATLAFRRAWYINQWSQIRAEPACSRHDRELGYTLRPGKCRFANLEFDTEVRVNRLGVRDDAASLEQPEIVILGDSYAMGWGVTEEATFGSKLEQMAGLRVLNAGISSYGTAQELALLRRIDGRNIRHLIVQYHPGDFRENVAFAESRHRLAPRDSVWYADLLRSGAAVRDYYPAKASVTFKEFLLVPPTAMLNRVFRGSAQAGGPEPNRRREAALFLEVLATAPVVDSDVNIIVLELADRPNSVPAVLDSRATFVEELRRLVEHDQRLGHVRVLDAMSLMSAGDYFEVDPHANARGHDKVARLLHAELCSLAASDDAAAAAAIAGCAH